ncbi:thiamine-phosphate pyrophosphorylase, putative [Rubellimicrobium mesophilum DSM 19309]|uniref:Thiamine-phosphate pyrophosphorylase, putative n=1 Tax=Rubellimicrobium mesophilum DSM 19309 TaxID=442562 RepID=A0A017HHI5_9RHOB|nr:thiamine phosphate synthase [Rubellimicrobium mesophilum]EYD73588.1 thiamine-phosphate pyrophosphorylase, putative [Rubellimicrobium mesophilum DSM 19309]
MTDTRDRPQITLVTPPELELSTFPDLLGRALDAAPVACLRLALSTRDEDRIGRAADALREVAHARDIPLVIEGHVLLVGRLGLDGVHLTDGARSIRKVRKDLGDDAIVGAFCGASRHDGMTAGELGADYVSFGPVGATGLGDGRQAGRDLFEWWSEMIEVPVIAEGALDEDLVRSLSPVTDFFAFSAEVWDAEDPAARLRALDAAMG